MPGISGPKTRPMRVPQSFAPKAQTKKKLKDLMRLPKERPNPLSTFFSVVSGTALSWGVEIFDDEKVKEAAIQEATNTGLLTALLLTISAAPLLGEAPGFFESVKSREDVWFAGWFLSTLFFALATIVSVMQNVMFSTLTGEEIRFFHERAGHMMHVPLVFFVNGTLLLLAAMCFGLYYAVSFRVWLGMILAGLVLMVILCNIVVTMSLLSYDCYSALRKQQEEESPPSELSFVPSPNTVYGTGPVPLQPHVEYVGNTAMYVNSPEVHTVPAYSLG